MSACGGDDNATTAPTQTQAESTAAPSGSGSASDACALLPASDIESTLGGTVSAGQPSVNDSYQDCTWSGVDTIYTVNVSVLAHSPDAKIAFNEDTTGLAETGVGDQAKWSAGQKQIDVLVGDSQVLVTVSGAAIDGDTQITDAKALARVVVGNLP